MTEPSDVVVIGSGVAGALVAWSLARVGVGVTILEAGPKVDRAQAVERLRRAIRKLPEAPYQLAPHAGSPASINDTYLRQDGPDPFSSTYLRVVGGTTWHWLGTALRLLPSDFEMRRQFGLGEDWPITYADLEPWYGEAERQLGVAGDSAFDLGSPRCAAYPVPSFPPTLADQLIARAATSLGMQVRVTPQARNSEPFDDRPICCASASCVPLCPIQAKYDATVHLAKAQAAGARLVENTVAFRIDIDAEGRVAAVVTRRPDFSEVVFSGRHVVLAANAIEGPKLLLMSRSERFARGVANRSDAVGRYLMDHPAQLTRALAPHPVWPRRSPSEVSTIHDFRDGEHRRRHGGILINVGSEGWDWTGPGMAELTESFIGQGLHGSRLAEAIRDHASRQLRLAALAEQLPDPDNRITLDAGRLDAIGVPKPRVSYRLGDYTLAALSKARDLHQSLFEAAGASEISHLPLATGAGHIMGTTRMGRDPQRSVADGLGRSHDHANLWFAGASLFPTAGTANPTLTIAALALRTAAAIRADIGSGR